MSFSDFDVTRRKRKGNFLNQVDQLIDWKAIEQAIAQHYALHLTPQAALNLEDDVPNHSVLSSFRTRLTAACAWDGLLEQINRQIDAHNIIVIKGYHVDVSRKARVNLRPSHRMKWLMTGKIGMTQMRQRQPCVLLK